MLKEFVDSVILEYGAEALPGYYSATLIPFSEQYQSELIKQNHRAFDRLIKEKIITGEMIWNFADVSQKTCVPTKQGDSTDAGWQECLSNLDISSTISVSTTTIFLVYDRCISFKTTWKPQGRTH